MSSAAVCGGQTFLYVASGSGQTISAYAVGSNGALSAATGSPFAIGSNLSSVAAQAAGKYAYAASGAGSVFAYTIDPTAGTLNAISGSPFSAGTQPTSVAVDPTGRYVYVANFLSSNISEYKIDSSTGALSSISFSPVAAGTNPNGVAVDPTGRFVFVANLNSSNISAYGIDQATGGLTPVFNSPFPAGSFPAQLIVDPTGRFLYVANDSNSVSAFTINAATGALTAVSGSPFAAQSETLSLTVDPTGRFLYAANYGNNNVSAYTIDPASGSLTPISGSPFPAGTGPTSVAVDPAGKFAYVTNALDGNISTYTIDSTSGALTAVSGSPFPSGSSPNSIAIAMTNGPILSLAKSHVGSFTQGQSGATYTLTASNGGTGPTTGAVTVTELVPAGLTLAGMAGSGWNCPSGGVICTRSDSLAAGMSYPPITVSMNVAANALATVTNVATVSGAGSLTASASDATTIIQVPVLTVGSSHGGTFYQGELGAAYSITVTNIGLAATSGTVTVTETVPAGLTLVSLGGTGWTCSGNGNSCTRTDALAIGTSYPAIAATVNVASNAPESVTNNVSVSGGGSVPASGSDVTIVPQPVLLIAKTHTGNFTQGQSGATYSVVVGNGSLTAPPLLASTTSATIGSSSCNDFQSVTLTPPVGGAAPVSFTVAVNYPNGNGNGDANGNWLYATIIGSGSTSTGTPFSATAGANGVTLTVGLNRSIVVVDTAYITITPTSPVGLPITITAFYAPNNNCGSNTGSVSNGFVSITPGYVAMTAVVNGQQSQTVNIQNATGAAMTFGYSVAPSNSWLSAQANTTAIAGGNTVSLAVTANAAATSGAGTYIGNLLIVPQSGFGSAINIPVTFTVTSPPGSNTGTLTVNGATSYSTAFSYIVPTPIGGQCIPIQDTAAGANSYSTQVTTSSGGTWLLANNQIDATTIQLLAPQFGACVNLTTSNVANTLASGVYQGQVAITSSSGSTANIFVNLYVSAGAAPGITVTPSPIYVFPNVAVNSNAVQQQSFSITAAAGYAMGAASLTNAAQGFSISTPINSGNSQSFMVTSDSTGLVAGVYYTTVTIASTFNGGAASITTIIIVLTVGQPASSGGSSPPTGPLTLNATSISFNNVTALISQNLNVTAANSTQFSVTSSETTCASSAWLQVPTGNYTASSTNTPLTITVDPTGIANGTTCAGAIQLTSSATQTVSVTMTVGTPGTGVVATTGTVTVTENPPAGMTLVSMAGTGWSCPSNGNQCSRNDSLAGSASYPPITVTVNVSLTAGSSLTNQVIVSGGGSVTAAASDTTTIDPLPSLSITESHAGNFVQGQAGATYSVTVSNGASSVPTSKTVTVNEIASPGLTLVSMNGSGWTCPVNGTTCYRSDSLSAGASYPAITVTVNVANNAAISVSNLVNVSYGGWTSSNAGDPTTVISACALTNDATPGVPDVQKVINEALGVTRAVDDLNLDGTVNSIDVQTVVSAALGAGCFIGGM